MSVKINTLTIKNFKSFDNIDLDFGESSLIVLDGPNGFGKTTIFDAIEMLFTGKIKRYQRIHDSNIDNRHRFSEHPFLCDQCSCGDIEIICKATFNGKPYTIRRVIKNTDLNGNQNVKEIPSKLYNLDSNTQYVEVDNELDFFRHLLGENYHANFEFINYIEQDENIGYLKQKDSNRKQAISHLFNTQEVDSRLRKLKATEKNIKDHQKRTSENIKILEADEKELLNRHMDYATPTEYVQLIQEKKFDWDQIDIDFSKFTYLDMLGESSDIHTIEWLISNINAFKNRIYNKNIDLIMHNTSVLNNLLSYSYHFANSDLLKSLYLQRSSVEEYINNLKSDLSKFIVSANSILKQDLIDIINDNEFVQNYHNFRTSLITQVNSITELDKCLIDLRDSRSKFINNIDQWQREPNELGKCALCGYNWNQSDILLNQIKIQSDNIETIINLNISTLNKQLSIFKTDYIDLIVQKFNKFCNTSNFNTDYYNSYLSVLTSVDKAKIEATRQTLDRLGIQYLDLLNNGYMEVESSYLDTLVARLNDAKASEQEIPWHANAELVFDKVFENKLEKLEQLDIHQIQCKQLYLQQKYAAYTSERVKKIRYSLAVERQNISNAKTAIEKMSGIINAYTGAINEYNNSVIDDIEVLFFIYSARIMQFRPTGSGFFINKNQNGIRFLEKPTNTYDALFKLSSGQLSSLIISFTLALNKKYSNDKLLFIDDPVQTLDDLNISSFIDVLRNDFSDRQIFISTHEDMMSAYIRYKFEKYNLSTTRINLSQAVN